MLEARACGAGAGEHVEGHVAAPALRLGQVEVDELLAGIAPLQEPLENQGGQVPVGIDQRRRTPGHEKVDIIQRGRVRSLSIFLVWGNRAA